MRLKLIAQVSFRRNEVFNRDLELKQNGLTVSPGECVLLVSKTGNQLLFVYGDFNKGEETIIKSTRYRLKHGTWNPLMIQNYANELGLKLDNIKRFETYYRALSK